MARRINESVMKPLMKAAITEIAVTGFLLRLTKGSKDAAKTPRMIVMRYLGYLETLEKNSPITLAGLRL